MATETFPVAMPEELMQEVRRAAKQTGLSLSDVLRQATKLGIPRLIEQLAPGRVTNVDPLPEATLQALYSERQEDMQSIRRFIAAQPKDAE